MIDGTDFVLANNANECFMNERNHWRYDSPEDLAKAAKKVDTALERSFNGIGV